MKVFLIILGLLAVAGGSGAWYFHSNAAPAVEFRTEKVERGDLVSRIAATGTVEPEEVIDVGAQVAGLIETFGTDANDKQVDFRSPVKAKMVLAHIDDAVYRADVDTANAQMEQAKANIKKGEADQAQANAKLAQAEKIWKRAEKMGPSDALSQNDYEMYKADYETAKANVAVAEAEIAQGNASKAQAQASLNKANRNLGFCTITSPVDGVIIARRVNIGQTVVSSLNAPSLFLIAKDLTKMQVWVAVNEADIGQIHPGTPVSFTCDAFQGRSFKGVVGKVRLDATMTQNVVTYTVEVNTDNSDGTLLPYLTANVQFETRREPNVLMVPNAALRWYPTTAEEVAPDARAQFKPVEELEADESDGQPAKPGKPGKVRERFGMVWIKDGQFVRPVKVKVGSTDDVNTVVQAETLKEGAEVVVAEMSAGSGGGGERSAFLPQMKRKKRR